MTGGPLRIYGLWPTRLFSQCFAAVPVVSVEWDRLKGCKNIGLLYFYAVLTYWANENKHTLNSLCYRLKQAEED